MIPDRYLLVTADDFGIGPETSRGILELAARGAVTSAVLLVNSPFAADAVARWRTARRRLELGWHPCLTLDAPILPPEQVPSLVDSQGRFRPLGRFLARLAWGRINAAEVEAEFRAQYRRFVDLVGHPPANVNAHHHVHVFRPIGAALARVLADQGSRPFVRRVVESGRTLRHVPGARLKRRLLSYFGRRAVRCLPLAELPGNESLIGLTDPPWVRDPQFFARWLRHAPGRLVELTCHPGHADATLLDRDGTFNDGRLHRRPAEWKLLADPAFPAAVRDAGFTLVTAAQMRQLVDGGPSVRLAAA